MEVGAYQDLMQQVSALNTLAIENPELAQAVSEDRLLEREWDSLTDEQRAILDHFIWLLIRHGDMAYYQYERGLLTRERLESAIKPFSGRLQLPSIQQQWQARRGNFTPGYVAFVDSLIATLP